MTVRYLAREGESIAVLARRFGLSRQTIYNQLARATTAPAPRPRRPSALDPHRDYLAARLALFDLPAPVLLRELRAKGYAGGLTVLRAAMRPLKAAQIQRVTERFETLPGRQAQADWGECGTITVGGETKKLSVFVLVLGYSRMLYARFTTSMKQPALFGCLQGAFTALGVPRELLVDNMKACVDRHDVAAGVVHWAPAFLDFAEHYGVLPMASPPYWPRVKGKVERGVGYVKHSFLEGRAFTDLADLNAQLDHWLATVANARVHGTTKAVPAVRFAEEQEAMRAAAAVPPYDVRPVELRVAALDCHVSYHGVRYSVAPLAAGHTVTIRPTGELVGDAFVVLLGDQVVATHQRRPRGTPDVMLPEHHAAVQALTRGQSASARRPGQHRPHFLQQPGSMLGSGVDLPGATLAAIRALAPVVETRGLAQYEAMLTGAAA
ncbi:MAG TPA: IS21 family transposase [Gemmatirosa sp.]